MNELWLIKSIPDEVHAQNWDCHYFLTTDWPHQSYFENFTCM